MSLNDVNAYGKAPELLERPPTSSVVCRRVTMSKFLLPNQVDPGCGDRNRIGCSMLRPSLRTSYGFSPSPRPWMPPPDGVPTRQAAFNHVGVTPLRAGEGDGDEGSKAQNPSLLRESLSGLVVALANVPSSVAFASIAGVSPLAGLWSSVIVGLVSALYGGRPGLIAGAAGVVVVPLAPIVAKYGIGFVAPVIILAALLQAGFALLRLGRFTDLVTPLVMSGFLNGLGLLLIKSQLGVFTGLSPGYGLVSAVGIATLTAGITKMLPRLTTIVPSSLAAVVAATLFSVFAGLPATTLVDVAGKVTFTGGVTVLPSWTGGGLALGALSGAVPVVLSTATSIALICFLETMLAARVVEAAPPVAPGDDLVPPSDLDRTAMGVALGNAASALFGGFGGCGLIPQTVLNVQSGGRGIASSISYALSMALCVLLAAPLIGAIPVASLAGLMLTVAFSTIQWGVTRDVLSEVLAGGGEDRKAALARMAILVLTSICCFKVDMATGIGVGVALDQACKSLGWLQRQDQTQTY